MTILMLNSNSLHIPLADKSVHCVVTSPPYYGLRDYGVDGQLGLEPTPEEFIAKLVAVFREVWRVLRDDGTLWVNIGDSYSGSNQTGRNDNGRPEKDRGWAEYDIKRPKVAKDDGCKPKDLIGIPWMLAFALRADGWYLRSDIIWAKPNPMPESVTDRPTKAHEYLFLLSKQQRYYYDNEAVREDGTGRTAGNTSEIKGAGVDDPFFRTREGFLAVANKEWHTRNRRTVWTIATEPTPYAHFATYPRALVEPCIKAGTSERGVCPVCGAPWERVTEKGEPSKQKWGTQTKFYNQAQLVGGLASGMVNTWITTGWKPTCAHDANPVPAIVLDPFGGSGTTAQVARQLGRSAIICDLSLTYLATIARKRLGFDALEAWADGVRAGNDGYHGLPLFQEAEA